MVARRAHNPKVVGSNPAPATIYLEPHSWGFLLCLIYNRTKRWLVVK